MDSTPFVPAAADLADLRAAAAACEGCPLHGPAGDKEDRAGRPFVGPAGRELDRALEAAGLDRSGLYVTNAVKHFRFEGRGAQRIHQKPTRSEIKACGPWLTAELDRLIPDAVLAMGATAVTN